jgi:outer membrane lipoprotein-sorting protein
MSFVEVPVFPVLPLVVAILSAAPPTAAAPVDVAAYLKRYDEVMAPVSYEAQVHMTAWREDGTSRTYKMRVQKSGADKVRLTFQEPKSAVGQEMLRQGDNLWVYMPNLKRAVRLASRDSFMGGDFNNADILRPHYEADYTGTIVDQRDGLVQLSLKARSPDAAWDVIKLWMTSGDVRKSQPSRAEFYASSGKMLRSASYVGVKDTGGIVRPSSITVKNELVPARHSEFAWDALTLKTEISPQRFVLDDLGR